MFDLVPLTLEDRTGANNQTTIAAHVAKGGERTLAISNGLGRGINQVVLPVLWIVLLVTHTVMVRCTISITDS